MPAIIEEQRLRNFLFTIEVAGGGTEHKLLGITGLQAVINPVEVRESNRIEVARLAGHATVDNFTVREAPIKGCLEEPVGNFLFELDIQGLPVVHLRRVSGLGVSWQVIENKESNELAIQKLWGHRSYPDITVEAVVDADFRDQFKKYLDKVAKFTGPGPQFAHAVGSCPYVQDLTLRLLTHNKTPAAVWMIRRAWVLNWTPVGDLDVTGDDVALERITLALDPLPNSQAIAENIIPFNMFDANQQGSPAWYQFVSAAYSVPVKRDLTIHVYHPGQKPGKDAPKASYKVFNAWVSEIRYGDFDANADEILTREVTITAEGIKEL